MELTTLQFPYILELVDFRALVKVKILHYNLTDLTITAEFSEADIELAQKSFGAVIVHDKK